MEVHFKGLLVIFTLGGCQQEVNTASSSSQSPALPLSFLSCTGHVIFEWSSLSCIMRTQPKYDHWDTNFTKSEHAINNFSSYEAGNGLEVIQNKDKVTRFTLALPTKETCSVFRMQQSPCQSTCGFRDNKLLLRHKISSGARLQEDSLLYMVLSSGWH